MDNGSWRAQGDRTAGDGSCLVRLRAGLRDASATERRIIAFVLGAPEDARDLSVTALAQCCGVSQSSVSRLCRRLGYGGYRSFQLDLAASLVDISPSRLDVLPFGRPSATTVAHVFEGNRRTLTDTERILDAGVLLNVASRAKDARRICLFGWGASGLMARYGAQRLMSVGLSAFAMVDPYDQLFAAAGAGRNDMVVGISHSGESMGVVEAVRTAHRHGAYSVALTNYADSTLARASDAALLTAFREHRLSAAFSSSHVAQMSVLDALYFLAAGSQLRSARRLARDAEQCAKKLRRQTIRRERHGRPA